MFRKRLTTILLAMSLAAVPATTVAADTRDEIASAKAEKSEAELSLALSSGRIDAMQNEKNGLQSYLDDLNTQIAQLADELDSLNSQIEVKKTEVEMTKASVERARIEEQSQYDDMKERIRYMYEQGNNEFFVSLLETKDITEFLTRAGRIKEMASYDRKRLNDYKNAKAAVEKQQAALETEEKNLETLKAEQETKKAEIQEIADTTDSRIAEYTDNISAETLKASNLQVRIDEEQDRLNMLRERLAAEQEAERQAEIRAAAAAAYAAQKAAQDAAAEASAAAEAKAAEAAAIAEAAEKQAEEAQQAQAEATAAEAVAAAAEAEENAQNAQAAMDIADTANNDTTAEMARQIAEAAQAEAEAAAAEAASQAAEAEAAAQAAEEAATTEELLGHFKVTAYCNCAKCCGTAGNATASGVMPTSGHTVAMGGVDFGTELEINGQTYTVEDRGTPYGHVDIYFDSHEEALQFGMDYADVYEVK